MKMFGLIIGALLVCVVAYLIAYPRYSWHQKLTVEVETPEGIVSGSSVVGVTWKNIPQILPDPGSVRRRHYGEATMVELPNGKYLFALLGGSQIRALHVFRGFKANFVGPSFRMATEVSDHEGEVRTVQPEFYPMFVTFTDVNDPTTVRLVDPNDLAASFGEGYRLKNVSLEITDESITEGHIAKVLPWFLEYRLKSYRLDGKNCVACPVSDEDLSKFLHVLSFKIGD